MTAPGNSTPSTPDSGETAACEHCGSCETLHHVHIPVRFGGRGKTMLCLKCLGKAMAESAITYAQPKRGTP